MGAYSGAPADSESFVRTSSASTNGSANGVAPAPRFGEDRDVIFVVLQLSDLHRSAVDPVGNAELVAALESDRARWPPEVAHGPDAIVISGDLVQGVRLGATDHDEQ